MREVWAMKCLERAQGAAVVALLEVGPCRLVERRGQLRARLRDLLVVVNSRVELVELIGNARKRQVGQVGNRIPVGGGQDGLLKRLVRASDPGLHVGLLVFERDEAYQVLSSGVVLGALRDLLQVRQRLSGQAEVVEELPDEVVKRVLELLARVDDREPREVLELGRTVVDLPPQVPELRKGLLEETGLKS